MILIIFSLYGKSSHSFDYVKSNCVGAGISILVSNSYGLVPYIFLQKMETTRRMRDEMVKKMKNSCRNRHFVIIVNMNKVPFPISTWTWRVSNHISCQSEGINKGNECTTILEHFS